MLRVLCEGDSRRQGAKREERGEGGGGGVRGRRYFDAGDSVHELVKEGIGGNGGWVGGIWYRRFCARVSQGGEDGTRKASSCIKLPVDLTEGAVSEALRC